MAKPLGRSEILASTLVHSVTEALAKLLGLWTEMGISTEKQVERMQTVKAHIETLLNEMIEEETNLKEKIEHDIEVQKNELNVLRLELGLDSYQVEEGLSILQLEKMFRLALEAAVKEKQERLKEMKQLQHEDQTLCVELCSTPYYIPTGSIPSCLQLEELKEHVQNLLKLKEQRLKEFLKLRKEIRQYNKEIGHTPDGTLETEILSDEEEYVCLTKKNLEDLQLLVDQLQVKKKALLVTREDLEKEVQLLWDRLQWPQEQREQQRRIASKGSLCEALTMWEEELQKLEELQKEKLKELTLKVRQEIDSYWEKCFYSDEQRAAFHPFYNDDFSEELLNQHDEQLLKTKLYYDKNKRLYTGVQKWKDLWDQFVQLEKKSTDPSRLLNRGGNLLKDEKERSKIRKQLIKLSEELKKAIENWEVENGSCFLVDSQRFLDSMTHQLDHHKLKKEQPKSSIKRDETTPARTAVKRPADVTTPAPAKICKVNEASVATVMKEASCSNIPTNVAVAGKQPLQTKMPSKSVPVGFLHQPPLEECKGSKPASHPSYSDFVKDLIMKASSDRIFNSTLRANLHR